MAGTCRLLHRAWEAESLFLRAMECYRQAGLEDSDAYTSVLNNLSLVYRETGDLEKAIDYLRRALKRLEGRGDRPGGTGRHLQQPHHAVSGRRGPG